jgi:nitrilase
LHKRDIAAPQAVSMFIGPSGEFISDTLCESEGLLYQDIDITPCVPNQFHDVVGYYNRFDVLDLKVTRRRLSPVQFLDVTAAPTDNRR